MSKQKQLFDIDSKKDIKKTIAENTGIKLTIKQETFCQSYVRNGGIGAKAALDAGYKGNTTQLSVIANQNLSKLYIMERIEQIKASISKLADVHIPDKHEVLQGIAAIANSDTAKAADKLKAWELLGKYHTLFTDKLSVQNSVDYAAIINNSRQQLNSIIDKSTTDGQKANEA